MEAETTQLLQVLFISLPATYVVHVCDVLNQRPCPCFIGDAGLKSPPIAVLIAKTISPACTQCGILKKSGKHSCCARGGAWFKNCGDAGDSNFDHTWVEGIQACKYSKYLAVRIVLVPAF